VALWTFFSVCSGIVDLFSIVYMPPAHHSLVIYYERPTEMWSTTVRDRSCTFTCLVAIACAPVCYSRYSGRLCITVVGSEQLRVGGVQ